MRSNDWVEVMTNWMGNSRCLAGAGAGTPDTRARTPEMLLKSLLQDIVVRVRWFQGFRTIPAMDAGRIELEYMVCFSLLSKFW